MACYAMPWHVHYLHMACHALACCLTVVVSWGLPLSVVACCGTARLGMAGQGSLGCVVVPTLRRIMVVVLLGTIVLYPLSLG